MTDTLEHDSAINFCGGVYENEPSCYKWVVRRTAEVPMKWD